MKHQSGKAILLLGEKYNLPGGLIVQIRIWRLPVSTGERPHGLKYSLFYGRRGERIVGYDNEDGKGDHRHYRGREETYEFVSIEKLIEDFRSDVMKETGNERG